MVSHELRARIADSIDETHIPAHLGSRPRIGVRGRLRGNDGLQRSLDEGGLR